MLPSTGGLLARAKRIIGASGADSAFDQCSARSLGPLNLASGVNKPPLLTAALVHEPRPLCGVTNELRLASSAMRRFTNQRSGQ
jgi:hypothetical protein